MPLTVTELALGILILVGIPLAAIWLNKRRHPAGWWLVAAVATLFVTGWIVEFTLS